MKIVQVSIEVNHGSVGRIAELIGNEVLKRGGESYITFARGFNPSKSKVIKIGNKISILFHALMTRLFDRHCYYSGRATKKLIKEIEAINPDLILLHHIHGYFLNMIVLFNYLKKKNIPIVWVFHDFWSITGHCAHFIEADCDKWKTGCCKCPIITSYPKSFIIDNSHMNFYKKKELFTSIDNLTVVTVSKWVESIVRDSFLKDKKIKTIYNSVNTCLFKPNFIQNKLFDDEKRFILGVATSWTKNKGLFEFYKLSELLPDNYQIVLVGLKETQLKSLPKKIKGITRTESIDELTKLYTQASVHVSLSFEETFGLTLIESMACGTPVVAYNIGPVGEIVTSKTGHIVKSGDLCSVVESIKLICDSDIDYSKNCIKRVSENFDSSIIFKQYVDLFENLI